MSLLKTLTQIIRRFTVRRPQTLRRRPFLEALEDRISLTVDLLVSSFGSNNVLRYEGTTGASRGVFASGGGLAAPKGLVFGPDDNLYVSGRDSNAILRFDGTNGAFLGDFVTPGSGGLSGPHGIAFGPDGNFYVNSGFNGAVLRYNGSTGQFIDNFVGAGSGGLSFPHGMVFGPDGNLYVGDRNTSSVQEYSGSSGAFLGTFVPAGSGGLNQATGVTFGPDGNLYVSSFQTNNVLRYDGKTGAFLGVFTQGGSLNGTQGLTFGPDGNLYVSSYNTDSILCYNGKTGAFLDVFASGGGLVNPTYLIFHDTDTTTAVSATGPLTFGQAETFTATVTPVQAGIGSPGGSVTFLAGKTVLGTGTLTAGSATLTTSGLGAGNHSITAVYGGDSHFSGSTSAVLTQTVAQADTTTVLNSSSKATVFGQLVTFTASVTAQPPRAGTPSGTVTFMVDGAVQPAVLLANGQASLTLRTLATGKHTVSAAYNGDGNFHTSTSAGVAQAVHRTATLTALASSADPAVKGQAVTFTVTVTSVAPGAGTPAGMVLLLIDGRLRVLTLHNGTAQFTTSKLSQGDHLIAALYEGDTDFTASLSTLLIEKIRRSGHHHHHHHHHVDHHSHHPDTDKSNASK